MGHKIRGKSNISIFSQDRQILILTNVFLLGVNSAFSCIYFDLLKAFIKNIFCHNFIVLPKSCMFTYAVYTCNSSLYTIS